MAKNSSSEPTTEATADAALDTAAVNEPTKHEFPTQQTATEGTQFAVATEELFVGGVRAHNPGDLVPLANVDKNSWGDKVRAL